MQTSRRWGRRRREHQVKKLWSGSCPDEVPCGEGARDGESEKGREVEGGEEGKKKEGDRRLGAGVTLVAKRSFYFLSRRERLLCGGGRQEVRARYVTLVCHARRHTLSLFLQKRICVEEGDRSFFFLWSTVCHARCHTLSASVCVCVCVCVFCVCVCVCVCVFV